MDLKNDTRQKNTQVTLDFDSQPTGEARPAGGEATESFSARHDPESPASTNRLMEEICERENLKQALQQVKTNKGSAGVDGMTVGGITDLWLPKTKRRPVISLQTFLPMNGREFHE